MAEARGFTVMTAEICEFETCIIYDDDDDDVISISFTIPGPTLVVSARARAHHTRMHTRAHNTYTHT